MMLPPRAKGSSCKAGSMRMKGRCWRLLPTVGMEAAVTASQPSHACCDRAIQPLCVASSRAIMIDQGHGGDKS